MEHVLKTMECPVCLCYMTGNIILCDNGHSICQPCSVSLTEQTCPTCRVSISSLRNYGLEEVAKNLSYPCKHESCRKKLSSVDLRTHETICKKRSHKCPLYFFGCSWTGKKFNYIEHVNNTHSNVINNLQAAGDDSLLCLVKIEDDEMFLIFTDVKENIKYYSAVYAGFVSKPENFMLQVTFKNVPENGYKLQAYVPCIDMCDLEKVFEDKRLEFHIEHSLKNHQNAEVSFKIIENDSE